MISINNNYLKRYNSKITIRLDKKEKEMLKRRAFKMKLNMSEYLRALILINNRLTSFYSNIEKANKNLDEIFMYESFIGRNGKLK